MEITRLVRRAKRKDADAFTELMESQMQNMYKVARSILSSEEDVADAISDTILVCWEKIDTLKKNRFFRTWMTRILINKCNDILRARQRTIFTDEPLEIEYMENEFLNLEWREMLQSLDEKYRIVLLLYYGEGFSIKEIAQILELTESAIKSRLSRGREQVKKNMMQEEFVMRKAEKELKKQLRQDVEIPSVVRRKADMAFTKIKNEAKQDEARKAGKGFIMKRRIAIVAAVLTLVIGTGTLAGVQYTKWSDGVNISVHGTDKQKEKLEKQGYTSYPNVSVTRNGVTITVTQCVADSYGAVISLKVEGYQPPKGKAAAFGKLWFPDSKDTITAGGGGFYEVSSDEDGNSNTVKEDGTMEYIIGLSAGKFIKS